jgi:hypothetical protein
MQDEQRLIEALLARAADDARQFRSQHPDDAPSERWIENSYTAALPLAKDSSGIDPGLGPHPQLFDAYRREIETLVGERGEHIETSPELAQQPTPGEN